MLHPSAARGSVTRPARKGQPQPFEPSRPRQRQLYQVAQRSRKRRFQALDDRLFRPDLRWRAWRAVRAHGGRAGLDAVQRDDVERPGVTPVLQARAQNLRAGSDSPQPGRRVSIPPPDGRHRPLGIPTVRDRVVQQACTIVIEPRLEANVQDTSDGLRPPRSATQAVKVVQAPLLANGSVVAVDSDSFFDTRDHALLRRVVARRISDRRVFTRRRQWRTVGVVERASGTRPRWAHPTAESSARCGPISPCLGAIGTGPNRTGRWATSRGLPTICGSSVARAARPSTPYQPSRRSCRNSRGRYIPPRRASST